MAVESRKIDVADVFVAKCVAEYKKPRGAIRS